MLTSTLFTSVYVACGAILLPLVFGLVGDLVSDPSHPLRAWRKSAPFVQVDPASAVTL